MITLDNFVLFSKDENPAVSLRSFWEPEDGFVWSTGKWCDVTFSFDGAGKSIPMPLELILDIDVFKHPEGLEGQNVLTYMNGLRIGSDFITRRLNLIFLFDGQILRPDENVITFDTPNSTCPNEFGVSDLRVLGIQLFSIQFRKAS